MSRLFWLALGAALGGFAVRRVTRVTRAWTPAGVADQAAGWGYALRDFAGDVQYAADEREDELLDALGLADEPMSSRSHRDGDRERGRARAADGDRDSDRDSHRDSDRDKDGH